MKATKYSDTDLAEFDAVIEEKLNKATAQYESVMQQLKEIAENNSSDNTKDLSDFSSSQSEIDMLNTFANRQLKYINDLQAARIRIRNKTYGICSISGNLIDKRRLLAVPTTTKSLMTKMNEGSIEGKPPVRIDAVQDRKNRS